MTKDMIAISGNKLPSFIKKKEKVENVFANAMGAGGFPVVSIKGKVFHVTRGDERKLITKPGEDDEPASGLEVVILATNPNKSKVYYAHGYEEGSVDKPDCYSNDGIRPATDAENPQSAKCAVCPHNQWGSRITDNGKKGKSCSDSMRLAIAPAGQLNDPMLLRVPAASLSTLGAYGSQLAKRGLEPSHVVTRISFDYNVAHPALTFKAVRLIEEDEYERSQEVLQEEEETIGLITGTSGGVISEGELKAEADEGELPEPPKAEEKPKKEKKPKKDKKEKKAKEEKPAPEPKEEPQDAAPEEEPQKAAPAVEDFDDIDSALDNLDFDD